MMLYIKIKHIKIIFQQQRKRKMVYCMLSAIFLVELKTRRLHQSFWTMVSVLYIAVWQKGKYH